MSIGLDPSYKCTKGIFDRSKFKVTRDISPTISGWLLDAAAIYVVVSGSRLRSTDRTVALLFITRFGREGLEFEYSLKVTFVEVIT